MCSNARIALPETEQTQQQTRRRHEIKCPAPTEMGTDHAADDIAQRAANRNGGAKNRHDPAAYFDREKIGQDCRRSRAGAAAGQAPQNHSATDDDPPRNPIGEQTENRRADHVSDEKRVAKQTGLRHSVYVVRRKKTGANIRLERGQNLPIDVIKQIDPEQKQQRTVRAANGFLHAAFHRQFPIADSHALIVNDKRCLPCPPLNARSISSAGLWCVAFIGPLRWELTTCRKADFCSCLTISLGWMRLFCSSPARGQFAMSSTRNFIASRSCIRFCGYCAASPSIRGILIPPFALRRKKSPKAKSFVFFPKASWNGPERCCGCGAVTN